MYNVCMNPNPCLKCNEPVAVGSGRTGKFCSRSCANGYNNIRRAKKVKLCSCGKSVNTRTTMCQECRNKGDSTTLGELKSKSIRDAQVYNMLRQRSRRIAILAGLTGCEVCGYEYHVEIAHIVALSKLPNSITVAEASNKSNFKLLCPNHHWEFDHPRAALTGFEPV